MLTGKESHVNTLKHLARWCLVTAGIAYAGAGAASGPGTELLTGDNRLACEAVLCLSTATRPGECGPALARYFGIRHKKWNDTLRARQNFLKLCPAATAEADMSDWEQRDPSLPADAIRDVEYRVLSCREAAANSGYAMWINPPNITGHAVPDGWELRRMGETLAVAGGGWANSPFYVGGRLIGWGYALESREVWRDPRTGMVRNPGTWEPARTSNCDIGNPESYSPPTERS